LPLRATCRGYPGIGVDREPKKALESYWWRKTSADDLEAVARGLRSHHWLAMKAAGLDQVSSNDFSLYDHMRPTSSTKSSPGRSAGQIAGSTSGSRRRPRFTCASTDGDVDAGRDEVDRSARHVEGHGDVGVKTVGIRATGQTVGLMRLFQITGP
jgi:hypothetical protein